MPNLVGIGNSQVPTNAMLGGLAYKDSVGEIDIDKIKAKISDTAKYIFLYDTSKDSDGGAWRHRTQNTSWYNEGVSPTRGARKEFPSIAVIVFDASGTNKVTIYDGDDPNLPMWMVFNSVYTSGNYGGLINILSSGVGRLSALNGRILGGRSYVSFIDDNLGGYWYTDGFYYNPGDGIVNRNNLYPHSKLDSNGIRNVTINGVAMTVLPNSKIDDATGLPVPTTALATDSGVSVIKDDGSVIDIFRTNDDDVHLVEFDGDRVIMYMELGGVYVAKIPDSDQSGNPNSEWAVYGTFSGNTSGVNYPKILGIGAGVDLVSMKDHTFATTASYSTAIEQYKGLSILSEDVNSSGNGISAWIGARYNTGWMFGDNKGAYLSDTTVETMSEGGYTNLLTNGSDWTGASGTTAPNGWTSFGLAESAFTIDSGRLKIGNGASNNMTAMHQNVTTVVGKTYTLYFNYQLHSSAQYLIFRVGTATLNGSIGYLYGTSTSDIQSTLTFVATQTSTNISVQLQAGSGNAYAWIDTMYVKAVGAADRSIRTGITGYVGANGANGFALFGSLDKTAVATGAELVAYGPFSNSNRLRQPYNSALNFETNDFSVMFWMNNSGTDAHQTLVGRDNREFSVDILNNSSYNRRFRIYAWNSADSLQTFDSNDDPFPLNTWVHVCVNYTSGNTATIYVNGVLNKTGTLNYDIDASSFTTTTHGLNIGARDTDGSYNYAATGTKLALVRISAGAPSADKVKKIYNDEKKLFRENAKCTLYGTSDEVAALAYDDTNDILHAGTPSGRSEFQGLNRINNTTTAVTTAISASNGFVAEQ